MTRPVARLEWWPNPLQALAIRLLWIGAPWNYLVDWGDGSDLQRVPWSGYRPVPHTYPMAGRYLVRVHAEMPNAAPVETEVVVRAALPEVTAENDGRLVRLTLPQVDTPVRYAVGWGDGYTSEHGDGDWRPEHTYRDGITRPEITVADMPARRWAYLTGPDLPRTAFPRWCFTGHDDSRRSTLWVGDLTAGAQWTAYGWQPGNPVVGEGVVGASGQISVPVELSGNPDNLRNVWTPFTVVEHHPDEGERRIYAAYNEDYAYGVHITYTWRVADPNLIGIALFRAPRHGTYTVDWGDGSAAERVEWNDGWTMCASHRYRKAGSYGIRVTAPDGTSGGVMVGPARLNGSRFNGSDMLEFLVADHPDTSTNYFPVLVDWGDGRGLVQRLPAVRVPNPSASAVTERVYGTEFHGREVTARWWAHWSGDDDRTLTVTHPRRTRDRRGIAGRTIDGSTGSVEPTTVAALGDGRYAVTSTVRLDPSAGGGGPE